MALVFSSISPFRQFAISPFRVLNTPGSDIYHLEHQTNTNTNEAVSLRDEFNRDKETETSKNERIPKSDGRSMKYPNNGNGIISTFVELSFLSMSVMRQIWKARRQFLGYVSLGKSKIGF